MKFLVFALFVGCVALVACTPEFDEKYKKFETECIAETGVDEGLVKKSEGGEFEDDAKLKSFLVCFMKKPGFINDAGEYQEDVIKKEITEEYDEATADKYIEKCTKDDHENVEDKAFHMVKCYHEHVMKH